MCAKNVAVKGMLIDLSLLNFLLEVIELHYISKNIHEFLEDEYTFYVIKYFLVFFATIRDMAKINRFFCIFGFFAYWLYFWQRRQIQRIYDWLHISLLFNE